MTRNTKLDQLSGSATSVSGRFFNILCQRYRFGFGRLCCKNHAWRMIFTCTTMFVRVFSTFPVNFSPLVHRENCFRFVFPRVVGRLFATEIDDSLLKYIENRRNRVDRAIGALRSLESCVGNIRSSAKRDVSFCRYLNSAQPCEKIIPIGRVVFARWHCKL